MTDEQQPDPGDDAGQDAPEQHEPAHNLDDAVTDLDRAIDDLPPSSITTKVQAVIDAARVVVDQAHDLAPDDTAADPNAEPPRPFSEQSEVQAYLAELGPEHRQLLAAGLSAFDDASPQSSGQPDDATGGNYHPGAGADGVHRGADGVAVSL